MRLVILGPNGSGKGTQAKMLKQELGVPHISTGELFRAAMRDGTPVGLAAGAMVAAGELVPDELVLKILGERLAETDAAGGYILDGYPRTGPQAAALDELLTATDRALDRVVELAVPDDVIIGRCEIRFAAQHRTDDDPAVVRERLALYRSHISTITAHYADHGIMTTIDGLGDVTAVFERILAALPR
ncbi:MAG: adenylate kinase [Nocardia sp.]|uniref:adenylate kinase n=1 Tax=Nocardia sp. TaxID=1821 RepID=UPI0026334141|nr:adenylate kinase [Nocardia sp.]MCU1648593.1 adenylate kinase [Nocardia sp.]